MKDYDCIMRRFLAITFSLLVAFAMVGCDSFRSLTGAKKTAQGAPYEVLVVCDGAEWESPLGAAIRDLFATPVETLNQKEPMFDAVRITARDFKHLLPSYRNILKVLCAPSVKECAMLVQYDVVASPQIVITFQGPSIEAMVDYLNTNGESLLRVLEIAERNRTLEYGKKQRVRSIEQLVEKKFAIEMTIPNGYRLRSESDDFIWISNEYPAASQGFFLYAHPFEGKRSLTTEALVKARNEFAQRIPGPAEGSYMTTVTKLPNIENDGYTPFLPERSVLKVNGVDWIVLRGFWDVKGDFMGGPFVSYTTLDKTSGKLVTLDCYVYSPKYGKRNFLRQLEHLVYGINFPTETDKKQ